MSTAQVTTNRLAVAVLAAYLSIGVPSVSAEETGAWSEIRTALFADAPILAGDGVVGIEAPERAEDAALVPVTLTLSADRGAKTRKVTLIVDENPAPVAAVISFGPGSGSSERRVSTRLRLDRFTSVRAVAELDDGSLHMASRFVKASGGCSAPASKDAEAALADLGKMQITSFDADAGTGTPVAQIAVRHPNFTGLQIDQVTKGYRPARFIDRIDVRQDDELVIGIDSSIAISENPNFRFTYRPRVGASLDVSAHDTDGATFTGRSSRSGS